MSHVDAVLEQWNHEKPDLDVSSMGLTGRLKRIGHLLEREMEKVFNEHGLTLANFDVLATLRRSGSPYRLSPGELLQKTMVTSGTMTHRGDQLVNELTRSGLKLIDSAVIHHVANLDRLTGSLNESEFLRLDRLLEKYLSTLEAIDHGTTGS